MSLFRTAELQAQNPLETILTMAKMTIEKKDPIPVLFKQAA
jgi:hypothetical protein